MQFPMSYPLVEIAALIDCDYVGDAHFPVSGMNEIHVVEPGDIVFVDHPKYYDKALNSKATVILINKNVECPEGKALLISNDPFSDFNKLTKHFRPFQSSNSSISDSAEIGENTVIQPNVFIGNHVRIGDNCVIHPNVAIYDHCVIGNNVVIHAGTVIGADAFYYKKREWGFDPLVSGGRVVIKDNVGHDTFIGKRCLIASQTGIAGCVVIEDNVTLWGQVGTTSGITIGSGAVIMGQTGVTKSVPGGKTYFGTPIEESREKLKQLANIKKIPELIEKLKS